MIKDRIATTVVIAIALGGAWGGYVGVSMAHDAIASKKQPMGWTYDYSCCSVNDCSEVDDKAVKVTEYGYQIVRTKEVIPYNDKRIKRSKDEFYHRCVPGGNVDAIRSLCLYVPDRAG